MKPSLHQRTVVAAIIGLALQIPGCALLQRPSTESAQKIALPSPTHRKIVLHGVQFDRSRGMVVRAARPVLDAAIEELRKTSPVTVVVVGPFHPTPVRLTDLGPLYCPGLGVEDYFSAHGVDASRIGNVDLVEAPLADRTAAARAPKTCRVELDIP